MNLFTYGTLMDHIIMDRVAGERFSSKPATLPGYVRKRIHDAVFPAISVRENNQVEGMLYLNVTTIAMDRLDIFEGDLYDRRRVNVIIEGEGNIEAYSYVLKPKYILRGHIHDPLSTEDKINNTVISNPASEKKTKIPSHNIIELII